MTGETDAAGEKQQIGQPANEAEPTGTPSPPQSKTNDQRPETNDQRPTALTQEVSAPPVEAGGAAPTEAPIDESSADSTSDKVGSPAPQSPSRRIKIGSQRDDSKTQATSHWAAGVATDSERGDGREAKPVAGSPPSTASSTAPDTVLAEDDQADAEKNDPPETHSPAELFAPDSKPTGYPPPNIRDRLSADLEQEFEDAMAGESVDELVSATTDHVAPAVQLEPHTTLGGRIVAVHNEDVFIDLGGRNQGVLPLKQFTEPPKPGTEIEVVVSRYDPEDGLYELSVPGGVVSIGDWSQLTEGMVIEVQVTGHNKGGLDCQVKKIRGFIPASQIALYHVADFDEFVGQKIACVVTEAHEMKRNLVLSRRAVLEREQEAAREKLLAELEPGQIREGVVRNIRDFGAFVDLGGVDGLLHISQLAWGHIKHPDQVLQNGQSVKVKIRKIDPETGKISLSLKDLLTNPWDKAALDYPAKSIVTGRVSKIMDFGAFVELESGIEGLIHISELAPNRVVRVTQVVSVDQEVEVMVLSVDTTAQRMSLSLKALAKQPEAASRAPEESEPEESSEAKAARAKRQESLKGGLGRSTGGEGIGLNW